ncbi:MAG: hypothetical protein F6K07_32745 [Okeania sp. SIO1H5]|uniref:hypothetical protein n=1 Tax=Okeania sp. SIO1H5 TaxID=2607777 RepID=UPI0013BCD69E|nr:hypothetical protein [Okeania sp. SIO1H5]NET23766.1 hypothetical protein [Okeania sp. SIO1H5]
MQSSGESFEKMLTGGHPNSLGRTLEVVDQVLNDQGKLEELYQGYFSEDAIVRLRVSSAIKRVAKKRPEWVVPYLDGLQDEIAKIDQASTQWTLAELFRLLQPFLTPIQMKKALTHLKHNLENHSDWIVLNTTMETLFDWSKKDRGLRRWLKPRLERLTKESRKSVAGRASKYLKQIAASER